MPRQVGPVFIEGTFGDLIFYKLGDHYYVRQKPARKKRKQMEGDERYERTLQKADQFGRASDISKWVYYRHVVKAVRRHGLFGELTGLVNRRLQAGQGEEEVKAWLIDYCQSLGPKASTNQTTAVTTAAPVAAKSEMAADGQPDQPVAAVSVKPQPARRGRQSNSKQPRYLSRWKVNRRGRLQVPTNARAELCTSAADMDYCYAAGG